MFVIRMRDYDVMRVKPTGRMNDMNFALCVLRNDALQVYVRTCVRTLEQARAQDRGSCCFQAAGLG